MARVRFLDQVPVGFYDVNNGGTSTPGGPFSSIQYNDGGTLNGDSNLLWNKNTDTILLTGSIIATNFTGSLFGTSSWAQSSSQAQTASYVVTAQTASYVLSSSYALSSSQAQTASYVLNAVSASYALSSSQAQTASYVNTLNQDVIIIGSLNNGDNNTAGGLYSHAEGANNATYGQSSHAEGTGTQTSGMYSHAEGFNTIASGEASHAEGAYTLSIGSYSHAEGYGTITSASYQHAQGSYNITSSIPSAFILGNGTSEFNRSNLIFAAGNQVQITGSLNTSGSIFFPTLVTSSTAVSNVVMYGTNGQLFITASSAIGGGGGISGDYVTTASFNAYTGSNISQFAGTASFAQTASYVLNAISASYALSASQAQTASYIVTAQTASYVLSASYALSSSQAQTASYVLNAVSASYALSSSQAQTASYVVIAQTASYVLNAVSASFAATASYSRNLQVSGSINNVDYINFNTGSTVTQPIPGRLSWNDTDGTLDIGLKGGNVTLQIGQEEVARVVNKTGGNLLEADYSVVRVRSVAEGGAQGQRLAVVLAQANNDNNSATTLGVVTETINVNQEGFITTSGQVRGINTTGTLQGETWVDGDVLYLSPTTPGYLTNIKPQAPQHMVIVGYVEYAHNNQGKIFVKVDNGYEIDELHNVLINTGSLTSGQLLVRSSSVWINSTQLTGSYGLTGSLNIIQGGITGSLFGTASFAQSGSNFVITNTLSLDGNLMDSSLISPTIAGSNILFTQATGSYTSAHGKYTVYQGANSRAGEFVTAWNGTTTSYYDNSTIDIGTTTDVTFQSSIVTGEIQINAITLSSGWTVKMLVTYL